ncbi:hypothetical protein [Mesorhizobium sp. M1406]|uniref:hypothetical protein n=1 Tax=Mesorhizobium sp. M1406 TaxID=2957099 RepID=UPI00333A734D
MKLRLTIAALAASLAITGCMSTEELAARNDQICRSYGARPGTDAYVNCRVGQDQRRVMEEQASAQRQMASQQAYWNTVTAMQRAGTTFTY